MKKPNALERKVGEATRGGPLATVYRYETKDTPSVTVYRTRASIIAYGGTVLVASARQVPWSEVTASGLWEPARILAG